MVQILADTAPVRSNFGRGGGQTNGPATVAGAATTTVGAGGGDGGGFRMNFMGGPGGPGGMLGGAMAVAGPAPQITTDTVNRAAAVLAQPQVDALRQLQAEQHAQAALAAAMRAQFEGNRNNGATAPAGTQPVTPTKGKKPPGGG